MVGLTNISSIQIKTNHYSNQFILLVTPAHTTDVNAFVVGMGPTTTQMESAEDNTTEALHAGLWNKRTRPFISGKQGNKSLKLKTTGEKVNLGNREHRKSRLILENNGKCRFI